MHSPDLALVAGLEDSALRLLLTAAAELPLDALLRLEVTAEIIRKIERLVPTALTASL
ncbi:hypothetical protein AB0I35_22885 [Nocardia sp. NPDC050378]|uniref:hypothetical protein n=1 Tax=Nocardia sp. NPDC050378 TaxID=3155400 RepID=UPI0033D90C60